MMMNYSSNFSHALTNIMFAVYSLSISSNRLDSWHAQLHQIWCHNKLNVRTRVSQNAFLFSADYSSWAFFHRNCSEAWAFLSPLFPVHSNTDDEAFLMLQQYLYNNHSGILLFLRSHQITWGRKVMKASPDSRI